MDLEKEIGELFSNHYDEIVYHNHTAEVLSNVYHAVFLSRCPGADAV